MTTQTVPQPTRRRFTVDEFRQMAAAGVSEVWLVDLQLDTIAVYWDPSPAGYQTLRTYRQGERLSLLAFPGREVAVTDLLGEPEPAG